MQADGTIWIDTKISDDGMDAGFREIKNNADSVAASVKKAGREIEETFSNINVSKPIANAQAQIRSLETQLSNITADLKEAVAGDDDSASERLANKRVQIYERLELAREKLAIEVAAAAEKEAAAEEKAAEREAKAAQRAANAKAKAEEKELRAMTKPVRRFGSRLREIATGALVFNVISAGLRGMVDYFGDALMANDDFAKSLNTLNGSLRTAFQPILESITPALISLINWLNMAVQAVGRLFAAVAGKSYSDMKKNAQALNNQANAIDKTGQAAKEAQKYLAGFDEINKVLSADADASSATGNSNSATFEDVEIPSEWEAVIDGLAMRIKDIFFEWDNLNAEQIAQKLLTALATVAGGVIGFVLGGPGGALVGMTIGAGLGVVLSNIIFDGDGIMNEAELMGTLMAALYTIFGGLIGFTIGGPGGAAIGAALGLGLSFLILGTSFDAIKEEFDGLNKKVGQWSRTASETTENEFVRPTEENFKGLTEDISKESDAWYQKIIDNWDLAARTTEHGYIMPSQQQFAQLGEWIKTKMSEASGRVIANWDTAARTTESGYIRPTRQQFDDMALWIVEKMQGAYAKITGTFHPLPGWFQKTVTEPITGFFNDLISNVVNGFNNIARKVTGSIEDLIDMFNRVARRVTIGSSGYYDSGYSSRSYSATTYATAEVPQLARGAVIPPNHKFLAVLGDQTSGTNIEAPLSTIQEAVALVMEDMVQSNLAGHEATVAVLQQILEAVLGIELDGETLSNAVNNYNRKMAVVRGG